MYRHRLTLCVPKQNSQFIIAFVKKKLCNITYNLPELKLPIKSEIDLRSTHKLGDNI